MQIASKTGRNRTGIQMSPIDSAEMQRGVADLPVDGTEAGLGSPLKTAYLADAEPVGSVPMPVTATGMVASAIGMVTGDRPQALIDKLGERLAFERGGVRLYEALMAKGMARDAGLQEAELTQLRTFRNEEQQHFEWVADALRSIGADPTAQTPGADLVGVEAQGFVQAMNDPRTTFAQSLQVMLDAEAIDNAGWDMLIRLAEATGHASIGEGFRKALQQEQHHLQTLRSMLDRLMLAEASFFSRKSS